MVSQFFPIFTIKLNSSYKKASLQIFLLNFYTGKEKLKMLLLTKQKKSPISLPLPLLLELSNTLHEILVTRPRDHYIYNGKLKLKIKDHRITTKTQFTRPKLKVNRKKNLEQFWSKFAPPK